MGSSSRLLIAALLGVTLSACSVGPRARAGNLESATRGSVPGSPFPTITSEIQNAPDWRPRHAYRFAHGPFTRVVNGPGWDWANGSFRPGDPLAAYQLVSPGSCTSGAGPGPLGRGSSIADGSCVWKYLSRVDYVSLTGWAFDAPRWKSGTLYRYLAHVTTEAPLRAYELEDDSCRSTRAPHGTGDPKTALITTGDGCHWRYLADILYSSERSTIPTESFAGRRSPAKLEMHANYRAQLWNDREYVAGKNGEAAPIRLALHNDYRHEGGVVVGCQHSACPHLIVEPAPGEGFADGITPADPLVGYDPARGVAIRDSLPYRWPFQPAGLDVHDNDVDLIGLQVESRYGSAVEGMASFGNVMTVENCILEGGSNAHWTSHAALTTDTSSVIANSLVIARGPIGVVLKYPGFVIDSTIVAPDREPGSAGIETFNKWVFGGTVVANTAIFGFAHAIAHDEDPEPWSRRSSHNMTDAPAGDHGEAHPPYRDRVPAKVDVLPGTTYSVSFARAFVDPRGDWRAAPGSPLLAAGRAFGRFASGCEEAHPDCPQRRLFDVDRRDIIGTPRPANGPITIGAWQGAEAKGR